MKKVPMTSKLSASWTMWAEYDKDAKVFTRNILFQSSKPIVSKGYSWLTWKKCLMTLKEIKEF